MHQFQPLLMPASDLPSLPTPHDCFIRLRAAIVGEAVDANPQLLGWVQKELRSEQLRRFTINVSALPPPRWSSVYLAALNGTQREPP